MRCFLLRGESLQKPVHQSTELEKQLLHIPVKISSDTPSILMPGWKYGLKPVRSFEIRGWRMLLEQRVYKLIPKHPSLVATSNSNRDFRFEQPTRFDTPYIFNNIDSAWIKHRSYS
jgi:hypothetical protein